MPGQICAAEGDSHLAVPSLHRTKTMQESLLQARKQRLAAEIQWGDQEKYRLERGKGIGNKDKV